MVKEIILYNNKGIALERLTRYLEALKGYETAIQLVPDYFIAWINKGICLTKINKYSDALKAFETATQIQPTNHIAWNKKGFALEKLYKFNDALEAYNKAIQLNSDYFHYPCSLACGSNSSRCGRCAAQEVFQNRATYLRDTRGTA